MKNKKSDKLLYLAIAILIIAIVILLIIKSIYKPVEEYVNADGDSNYVSTKLINSKLNISRCCRRYTKRIQQTKSTENRLHAF